ncbi:hypothetical protein AVEN_111135-1, partial [Araneus ventricosus]
DRCVCGAKGDPNHYATVCSVTKPTIFSTWCEDIVQDKRSQGRFIQEYYEDPL